jgi:hypothetical protein
VELVVDNVNRLSTADPIESGLRPSGGLRPPLSGGRGKSRGTFHWGGMELVIDYPQLIRESRAFGPPVSVFVRKTVMELVVELVMELVVEIVVEIVMELVVEIVMELVVEIGYGDVGENRINCHCFPSPFS